jgi:formylglycine-generating enzyme
LRRSASPTSVEPMAGLGWRASETVKPLRLVVVSPSDVSAERDLVPEVLEQLNHGVCADRGLCIVAYRWEKQAYPAFVAGGVQREIIDPILSLDQADAVIAIFRSRLGTPDALLGGKTGSQHELDTALSKPRSTARGSVPLHVAVYHDVTPAKINWRDRGSCAQREALYRYFHQLEDQHPGFIAEYTGVESFRRELHAHLQSWVRQRFALEGAGASTAQDGVSAGRAPRAARAPQPSAHELLEAYHHSLRVEHARLLGLFMAHPSDLATVFVELDVATEGPQRGGGEGREAVPGPSERAHGACTLRQLMAEPPFDAAHAHRWVVLGHPGSGKSTLARHLAWELAGEHLDPAAEAARRPPLVVYSSLPALATAQRHPFVEVERALSATHPDGEGRGLANLLTERAQRQGAVWLLLDGLDEVTLEQRGWVDAQLEKWAAALPHVTIAVFSRVVGYRPPGPSYRAQAQVRPLSSSQQQLLLDNWLEPASVTRVTALLDRSVALREACQVPLSLSLLAFLALSGAEHPTGKRGLYDLGLDTLLERGHHEAPCGVRNVASARTLLGELSLALQDVDGEAWPRGELERLLRKLPREALEVLHPTWRDAGDFLNEVGQRSGVLAAHDGLAAPWRFFHRQFRELLAAEALLGRGRAAVLERAQRLSPEQVPRWAEVLGFACELSKQPLELLGELGKVSEEMALRVLPEVEGVDPIQALGLLAPGGEWDGDFLIGLFARWREQGTFPAANIAGWLWSQVDGKRSVQELAALHYALDHIEGRVDRERFFRRCERWPSGGPPEPKLVDIAAGEFLMGAPKAKQGRFDSEGPQRTVRLSGFRLSPTAVTNGEYAAFDARHEAETFEGTVPPGELGDHPVVNVSWWEAYLYSAWAGGSLPTEAQWEYACRAGTKTAYSFGGKLDSKKANTSETGLGRTVKVGSLPKSAWGLYEMHGNVWEWCADCHGAYPSQPEVDPTGPERGDDRVLRGGSCFIAARYARSAYRNGSYPADRSVDFGFRLARGPKTSK